MVDGNETRLVLGGAGLLASLLVICRHHRRADYPAGGYAAWSYLRGVAFEFRSLKPPSRIARSGIKSLSPGQLGRPFARGLWWARW